MKMPFEGNEVVPLAPCFSLGLRTYLYIELTFNKMQDGARQG